MSSATQLTPPAPLNFQQIVGEILSFSAELVKQNMKKIQGRHSEIPSVRILEEEYERTYRQMASYALDPATKAAALENAVKYNPGNIATLIQLAHLHSSQEHFEQALECYLKVISTREKDGETWGALGHCYLMLDDLSKAFVSYQTALNYMRNPWDPRLWFGIGILYDRYGLLDPAEKAFESILVMPSFPRTPEIKYRLALIYKRKQKLPAALELLQDIREAPPSPLTRDDMIYQIGNVYEMMGDFATAKSMYDDILSRDEHSTRYLHQMAILYLATNQTSKAVDLLNFVHSFDKEHPFTYYLLGQAFTTLGDYTLAYHNYQQCVYRDGLNPYYWTSIGVLYFKIKQFHDSLDAYSRAVKLNPGLFETWLDLAILYEQSNNQLKDAVDAYTKALQFESPHKSIPKRRIQEISAYMENPENELGPPPNFIDINPNEIVQASAVPLNPGKILSFEDSSGPRVSPGPTVAPPVAGHANSAAAEFAAAAAAAAAPPNATDGVDGLIGLARSQKRTLEE